LGINQHQEELPL